jgi:hypothetical protein
LLENAAAFSSEDTQVVVVGQLLNSGGALIEITDEGLGIAAEELAYINWRLDNPPVIDVSVSRRMGLFVVGRLAARHGIRVRLRPIQRGGLSALIWVPDPIAAFESALPVAGLRPRPERRRHHPFFRPSRRSTPAAVAQAAPAVQAAPVVQAAPAVQAAPIRRPLPAQPAAAAQMAASAPTALPIKPMGARIREQAVELVEPLRTTRSGLPIRQPAQDILSAQPAEPTQLGDQADLEALDAASGTPGSGLPIYDSVESDWFRQSGKTILAARQSSANSWKSPADEGFRVAAAAASPTTGAATSAGLPRRVPSANLIPGSVGGSFRGSGDLGGGPAGGQEQETVRLAGVRSTADWAASRAASEPVAPATPPPPPVGAPRQPEQVRSRLAALQRGARRGRTDAPWNFGADES